tara:strand:- start:755 stop:1426 length:672 start_codon:yes stop_codon:yes gene_type:complete
MAPKTLDGSAFSFTTTRGHTTHISILWVFVLFATLTVAVAVLGGEQRGLVERQFPDTKVNGDLVVTGGLSSKLGLIAPTNIIESTEAADFTAEYDTYHLLNPQGAGFTVTLPAPRVGSSIRFLTTTDATNNVAGDMVFTGGVAFATGSLLTVCTLAGASPLGIIAPDGSATLTLDSGGNDGGGGRGSTVELVGVNEGGTARWLVNAFAKQKGTGTDVNPSDFT